MEPKRGSKILEQVNDYLQLERTEILKEERVQFLKAKCAKKLKNLNKTSAPASDKNSLEVDTDRTTSDPGAKENLPAVAAEINSGIAVNIFPVDVNIFTVEVDRVFSVEEPIFPIEDEQTFSVEGHIPPVDDVINFPVNEKIHFVKDIKTFSVDDVDRTFTDNSQQIFPRLPKCFPPTPSLLDTINCRRRKLTPIPHQVL